MKKILSFILCAALMLSLPFCAFADSPSSTINILYTNDVHCAVDANLGYATLSTVKQALLTQGHEVLLVDNGDAIQGGDVGVFTRGEYVIDLMNVLGYDIAIPGNHEFDYTTARFLELREKAEFPYISCNFVDLDGNPVLDRYVIREIDGVKLGFVGVTTPNTGNSSNPTNFQDENGETIYTFCQDQTGEKLYAAVQQAVDDARSEGADYIIAMAHLGIDYADSVYTSSEVITHTHGIDAVLDGHSHSVIPCEKVKNDEGREVLLTSTGTGLQYIGCLTIDTDGRLSTALIGDPGTGALVKEQKDSLAEITQVVVGHSDYDLLTIDPKTGERMVRSNETNLGDFCADAYRALLSTDIALVNGGGVRADLKAGDITYGSLISVQPFNNSILACKASGQQILDALEMGACSLPGESGLLHVSGLSYTVDLNIESSVELDVDGNFIGVADEYRVKDVTVGGEPLDPEKLYTVASYSFILRDGGSGMNMFMDCEFLPGADSTDIQLLITYLTENLGGSIGEEYSDCYGQGRITIIEAQ